MSVTSELPLTPTLPRKPSRRLQRAFVWLAISALVLITAILLIMLLRDLGSGNITPQSILPLVLAALTLLLIMAIIVLRRAYRLWQDARRGLTGTKLQGRILLMFCGVTILPTLIVSVFSIIFFNIGVKSWFDQRVVGALNESVAIARAYMSEHRSAIQSDAVAIADEVRREASLNAIVSPAFSERLTVQAALRGLSEAIIFDRQQVFARTALSFSLVFERLPEEVFKRADADEIVVLGEGEDRIQAVIKISQYPDLYLLVSHVVDPTVIAHMQTAEKTITQFRVLERDIAGLRVQFSTAFLLLALLLLLGSIWAGMQLAARVLGPITRMVAAAERVRAGDYSIKLPEGSQGDEIATLTRTFNRMTSQLDKQRQELMEANRAMDERRRFTEAVLAGVPAGVMALDAMGVITLHNRLAPRLLGFSEDTLLVGKALAGILPECAEILEEARQKPERGAARQMVVNEGDARTTMQVRVTVEEDAGRIEGFIVTFDDITDLLLAQRSAAWADVARRIAHEIKNPLTPITLSTERLRKKYAGEIATDREGYLRYLDTITRHVRDIGRMVEEFVAFARMPAAQFREEDFTGLVRKAVFSEQTAHPEITYRLDLPTSAPLVCDERQVGQLLLNLLKNAAEAMEPLAPDASREITLRLVTTAEALQLVLEDTGPGFPPDKIERLTEPYVTTRAKGTGLGLAIVKRSMEEHKGSIMLANRSGGGAQVMLSFSRRLTPG
jgi:two-component system, NtrC family, nitrogen regulation sensor histidine kinase NtrY